MAAVELNLDPSSKQLRQFGLIGLFALPLLGWLFSGKPPLNAIAEWEAAQSTRATAFLVCGLVMGACAFVRPRLLKWVFVVASVITFPIGFVLGEVVMLLIFAIGFVPIALFFRWIGRDPLERAIDRNAATYWTEKPTAKDAASYFRQS